MYCSSIPCSLKIPFSLGLHAFPDKRWPPRASSSCRLKELLVKSIWFSSPWRCICSLTRFRLKIQALRQHGIKNVSLHKQLCMQLYPKQIICTDVFMGRKHEYAACCFQLLTTARISFLFQGKRYIVVSSVLWPIIKTLVKTIFWPNEAKCSFQSPRLFLSSSLYWNAHSSALMDNIRK